jgi:hypothetical protein
VKLGSLVISVSPVDGGGLQRSRPITAIETEIDIVVLEALLVEVVVVVV